MGYGYETKENYLGGVTSGSGNNGSSSSSNSSNGGSINAELRHVHIEFLGIDNIHVMRKSFKSLSSMCERAMESGDEEVAPSWYVTVCLSLLP
jgi:hypothetical protein